MRLTMKHSFNVHLLHSYRINGNWSHISAPRRERVLLNEDCSAPFRAFPEERVADDVDIVFLRLFHVLRLRFNFVCARYSTTVL